MRNILTLLLFILGFTISAQAFIYKGKHEYIITSKENDSISIKSGGTIKFILTRKEKHFGFAHGRITFIADDLKIKGRTLSLPYYEGLEFFDISIRKRNPNIRIIMMDGLFGVYIDDILYSFYDTVKIKQKTKV
jgi:hypothetical protein